MTSLTRSRGPAKGYIEGLEHRLHEAETLLLQLLPLVSSDQLASAASAANSTTNNGVSRDSPDHMNNRSSPPVLNKKTGIEYWENFPLDTVDNIRRWQQDCALHSHFKDDHHHRAGSSRPASVDVAEHVSTHSRKGSSIPQQYRSMSTDSYSGSQDYSGITPSRYNAAPPHTSGFSMSPQAAYAGSDPTQHWQHTQQVHQNGMPSRMATHPGIHHHHQQSHAQQIAVPATGAMDVDGGGAFFSGEVKRHLFW